MVDRSTQKLIRLQLEASGELCFASIIENLLRLVYKYLHMHGRQFPAVCTEQPPKSIFVVTARRSRIGRLIEKPKKKDLRLINPTLPYPIRLVLTL